MPTLIIKRIGRRYIMPVDDWLWVKEHLNQKLQVFAITWRSDGSVATIAIYKDKENIISLFPENKISYEVNYNDSKQELPYLQ